MKLYYIHPFYSRQFINNTNKLNNFNSKSDSMKLGNLNNFNKKKKKTSSSEYANIQMRISFLEW